jgi:hypothetical protein
MKSALPLFFSALVVLLVPGCGKKNTHDSHDHGSHGAGAHAEHKHGHQHTAPHGGTAVVLGDEAFHLEFVLDQESGSMTAYVLDAHMEKFVRCGATEFVVEAQVNGKAEPLTFKPVANLATDETVGDTSQFIANAPWLKTTQSFDAKLVDLTIRGTRFEKVAFNFPKGNESH